MIPHHVLQRLVLTDAAHHLVNVFVDVVEYPIERRIGRQPDLDAMRENTETTDKAHHIADFIERGLAHHRLNPVRHIEPLLDRVPHVVQIRHYRHPLLVPNAKRLRLTS